MYTKKFIPLKTKIMKSTRPKQQEVVSFDTK